MSPGSQVDLAAKAVAAVRKFFGGLGWRGWTVLALTGFVIAVVTVARLVGMPSDGDSSQKDKRSSQVAPTLPHDGDASAGQNARPDKAQVPQAAVDVAVRFVREWTKHSRNEPAEQWWQRVSQYADSALAEQLRLTDPSRVPAQRVTGQPRAGDASDTRAEVTVPTDGGEVLVVCTLANGVWAVSDIDFTVED